MRLQVAQSKRMVRDLMTRRHGFSLWLGPSQSASPQHPAGVYLRGRVPPGTVLVRAAHGFLTPACRTTVYCKLVRLLFTQALYPGAVYNSEMRQKVAAVIDAGLGIFW